MEHSGFFEFSFKALTDSGTFTGYASTFGNVDLQGDIVQPGAFARTLKNSAGRVPILMAHNPGRGVGFGTSAVEDAKGLKVTGEFTLESDEGRNAYASLKHAARVGHAFGLSIGYMIPDGGARVDEKRGVRLLGDIDLLEYSLASTPANTEARVTSVKDWSARDLERFLRDGGFSREKAKSVAAHGFRGAAADDDQADAKHAGTVWLAETLRQLRR